eukprot:m51a1_g12173 putative stress response protein nst1 (903) ;mRNA; f:179-4048
MLYGAYYEELERYEQCGAPTGGEELFDFGRAARVAALSGANTSLGVADELLKNGGRKFLELMERLAERRVQQQAQHQHRWSAPRGPRGAMTAAGGGAPHHSHHDVETYDGADDEDDEDDDDYDDEDEDDECDDDYGPASIPLAAPPASVFSGSAAAPPSLQRQPGTPQRAPAAAAASSLPAPPENQPAQCTAVAQQQQQQVALTDEQRLEEGRRMFQLFAAKMFEQRVYAAYTEKLVRVRQEQLIREEQLAEARKRKPKSADKQQQQEKPGSAQGDKAKPDKAQQQAAQKDKAKEKESKDRPATAKKDKDKEKKPKEQPPQQQQATSAGQEQDSKKASSRSQTPDEAAAAPAAAAESEKDREAERKKEAEDQQRRKEEQQRRKEDEQRKREEQQKRKDEEQRRRREEEQRRKKEEQRRRQEERKRLEELACSAAPPPQDEWVGEEVRFLDPAERKRQAHVQKQLLQQQRDRKKKSAAHQAPIVGEGVVVPRPESRSPPPGPAAGQCATPSLAAAAVASPARVQLRRSAGPPAFGEQQQMDAATAQVVQYATAPPTRTVSGPPAPLPLAMPGTQVPSPAFNVCARPFVPLALKQAQAQAQAQSPAQALLQQPSGLIPGPIPLPMFLRSPPVPGAALHTPPRVIMPQHTIALAVQLQAAAAAAAAAATSKAVHQQQQQQLPMQQQTAGVALRLEDDLDLDIDGLLTSLPSSFGDDPLDGDAMTHGSASASSLPPSSRAPQRRQTHEAAAGDHAAAQPASVAQSTAVPLVQPWMFAAPAPQLWPLQGSDQMKQPLRIQLTNQSVIVVGQVSVTMGAEWRRENQVSVENVWIAGHKATIYLENDPEMKPLGPCARCCRSRPSNVQLGLTDLNTFGPHDGGATETFVFDRCRSYVTPRSPLGARWLS